MSEFKITRSVRNSPLWKFLSKYKRGKSASGNSDKITLVSMGQLRARFELPETDEDIIAQFWDLLYDHIFVKKLPISLAERYTETDNTCIKIDIDFKWELTPELAIEGEEKGSFRRYSKEMLRELSLIWFKVLNQFIQWKPDTRRETQAFIFEKDSPVDTGKYVLHENWKLVDENPDTKEKTFRNTETEDETMELDDISNPIYKDGIHIMFPWITTSSVLERRIRKEVLKLINHLFEPLGLRESVAKIVDESVIGNHNWLLYMNRKSFCLLYTSPSPRD